MTKRKNVVTFYIHWIYNEKNDVVIENDDFDNQLTRLMMNKIIINPVLIDKHGIANSKINEVVGKFLRVCQEQDLNHYCPYTKKDHFQSFAPLFRAFLNNLFHSFSEPTDNLFDVFINQYSGEYFKVSIPSEHCPEDKYNNLLYLGPDGLFAKFSPQVVFDYVYPRFLLYLFDTDRLDADSKETDLLKYNIGLH